MKALVKAEAAPGLWLKDLPVPVAGPGEVLIRVLRTGICGTDLHLRSWDAWAQGALKPPVVLGHEIAGTIEVVGPGVDTVAVGDLVSVEGHLVCGRCRNCLAGRRQLCANTVSVGVDRDGGFAEFVAVPATNVWRHREGIDPDVAAIFDPFGNAVHCALTFPVLGEDVLISGAGPIGIMAASVVRHAGARNIVITDISADRLELALHMGAVTRAVDVAFDWDRVIHSMLTVKGIFGREMFETWYAMSVLVDAGLDISPVITHRFSYRDFDEAFDVAASGRCGKVILDWSEI